jgi:(p)ppGpp synthase/HD superfamily hydrolase
MIQDVIRALNFAKERHKGQRYGDKPYDSHLEEVMQQCQDYGLTEQYLIIAALHDTIEDTGVGAYEAIRDEFGQKIANAVQAISREKDEDYFKSYLPSVARDSLAAPVKACDILVNLNNSLKDPKRYGNLIKRYKKALFVLACGGESFE